MDVCVHPAAGEPFGLAALESMVLGVPTLVFQDGGGVAEVVGGYSAEDLVTGPDTLAARLGYYYGRRRRDGGPSPEVSGYARRFDISRTCQEFKVIYENIARKGPKTNDNMGH
jgi:glycosyltransferase involved in cell wall biosynthesis